MDPSAADPGQHPGKKRVEKTAFRGAFLRSVELVEEPMESVVLALASNEAYFPGLYCTVASALSHLDATRKVDLKILDGGIPSVYKEALSKLIQSVRPHAGFEFVPVDDSLFHYATLGPAESHMTYCRTLLPRLLHRPRVIYLDCDLLVFCDLSKLFDLKLAPGRILAAVPDSETLTLGDDSATIASAMNLPSTARYFNAGVMLLNLDELRKQNVTDQSLEFLKYWKGHYRFHDQSALNFLLHDKIEELPEYWNRTAWRFDEQDSNSLECVLHYTSSAPWLGGTPGPAKALFERFAMDAGFSLNRQIPAFRKSSWRHAFRNLLAPVRALVFPIVALLYEIAGQKEKCATYQEAARYWFNYIRKSPARRRLHRRRVREIAKMKFNVPTVSVTA
jgi:lipopolysaccharide biosynthesis glycosyltransferase